MKSYKQFLRACASSLTYFGLFSTAFAATHTWIGGNVDWVDGTGNGNWTPSGEPTTADLAIFNTPNAVNLGSNNAIASLTLTGGIDLMTNNHNLSVGGVVDVSGTSTNLIIGGSASSMPVGSMLINSNGVVSLSGGAINLASAGSGAITNGSAGTLSGFGTVNLNGSPGAATPVVINEGTLSALGDAPFIFGAPNARTLTLNAVSSNARIDLDGITGFGVVNVFRNQTLLCNVTINDAFSGTMNLYVNSNLHITNPWSIDSGIVNIHSGSTILVAADVAVISGGTLTQASGSINVPDFDGTLQFDAPFNMTGGNLVNNGLVIFNNDTTIGAAANFTMPNTASSLTVAAGVTTTINQPLFNLDGAGVSTNVLTINSGGTLNVALGAGSEKQLDGTINLNGGTLHITTDTANWTISGPVHVGASTGTSNITGSTLTITGATINVGAGSTLIFGAPTIWSNIGNLVIGAGATARLNGAATFSTPGSFTGTGSFLFAANADFNTSTLINMPGGTVNLTAATGIFSSPHTISFNANSTINANTLVSFGNSHIFIGNDTLSIGGDGFQSLSVHLTDPAAEWTLNSSAILNVFAVGGMFGGGGIQGSDFLMAGTANISGNSIWGARTDVSGVMNVAVGGSINFRGGTLANPNRLQGGTITGSGLARALGVSGSVALTGFGVINTGVDFSINAELRAGNGTLTVNGLISGVGILGTADTDGVLLVTNVWNTSVASTKVELKGGEIRGSQINNGGAGGIVGMGLVSAHIVNDTLLDANTAGTLIFQTGASNNDWDGGGNAGALIATANGTLELRDNADFVFRGSVSATAGGTVFTNGFAFNFQPGSTVQLNSGTYMESLAVNTTFGGSLTISAAADSKLLTSGSAGTFTFLTGGITHLNGNLQLDTVLTIVQTGATFSGAGSLINLAGRTLAPDNLATMNILLDNRGILSPALNAVGRVTFLDFQQSATGNLAVNLNGTGLNQFDRVTVNGNALLNGQLSVSLGGAFVPSLGDSFAILSATAGVSGAFSSIAPPDPVGLLHFVLDPTYNSTNVTLTVTQAYYEIQSGPYPQNFTGNGYQLWKSTSGTATITGNSSFTGTTTVFAGMLIVNNQNALGAGGLGLTAGTTVQLGSGLGLAVKLPFLAVAHTGPTFTSQLDLTDARFILQSTGGPDKTTKIADLTAAILAGSNGGTWTGQGITSSTAAADSTHYGVGLFDNAILSLPSLGGQTMDANSLLVAIAHLGDANRDAVVDIQDQSLITNNWQQPRNNWASGDLNLDGFVDIQDLTLVTNNWQQSSTFSLSRLTPNP